MPSAITAIFTADISKFQKEIARGEAIALGFSKSTQKAFQASSIASMSALKKQIADLDAFKTSIAGAAGRGMMGEKESAAKEEAIRLAEVEAVTRSNQARRLWRQRKADGLTQAKELAELETAAQIEAATRSNRARYLLRVRAAEREAKAAAEISAITNIARGYGSGVAADHHGKTGLSGIIRESLVIVREISMGRGIGRVAGSVTLLAQYLGLLGTVVKSTAAESVKASVAATKHAQAMAMEALAAKGTADYSRAATVALAAEAAAAQKATAAQIALKVARTAISPVGIFIGAFVLLAAAIGGVALSLKAARDHAMNLARITSSTVTTFRAEADAIREAADRSRELNLEMAKLYENHHDFLKISDDAIDKLHQEADAQSELNDAKKDAQLAQLDLDKSSGRISGMEHINRKAEIEKNFLREKSKEKLNLLTTEVEKRAADLADVTVRNDDAKSSLEKYNSVLTSPEYIKKQAILKSEKEKLGLLEEAENQARINYEKHKNDLTPFTRINTYEGQTIRLSNGQEIRASLEDLQAMVEYKATSVRNAEDDLTPDQRAASRAKEKADRTKAEYDSMLELTLRAQTAFSVFKKTSGEIEAQQEAAIESRRQQEIIGSFQYKGYGLNNQQRIGAYASTPPEWKAMVKLQMQIARNTDRIPSNPTAPPVKPPVMAHGG